ncbi:MAG: protein kinase [Candidatus Eisenbacteria bacterium]
MPGDRAGNGGFDSAATAARNVGGERPSEPRCTPGAGNRLDFPASAWDVAKGGRTRQPAGDSRLPGGKVSALELLELLTRALADGYRVERELGEGGMAVVFLAEDLKHHRRVAIKVLKPELSAILGSERFAREIEIAARLQHPHILPLHDSGQAGGLFYYVMPFVEGESLQSRLARERQLPIDVALQITREIGQALQYAHDHGVIHRDIKPGNIMLSGGHAVVTDFGIARAVDAATPERLTLTGMTVGTAHYMSPEQAGGAAVDGRSDQYSLACTAYEMLIGQPPFTGSSYQAVIARHSLDPVPSLRVVRPAVPPALEEAILRALAKVPADRFASTREFLDAVAPRESETRAQTVLAAARSPMRNQGTPRVIRRLAIALGMGVLVAAGAWWLVAGPFAGRGHIGARAVTAVAVFPFKNLASGPDSSYLGNGMTEGLIADLAGIGSLKVIAATSGLVAQESEQSLGRLASELGVGAVVEGSVQRTGDNVRVIVRFLSAPDSLVLLAGDYQCQLGELPDLQRKITIAITKSIKAQLKSAERSRLDVRREVNQRAYETYLRGRFHLEQNELEQARALFEQASRIAPNWAPSYVGLANYYTALPFSSDVSPAEVLPKARAALIQALALDETLPEAHATNAHIRAYYEWDWRAAEQEFRRALELRPNYADAYFSYGRFLASRRRLDEAIAQLDRAADLDPLAPGLQANRALLDYFAGRYDAAAGQLREILKRDSTDVTAQWGLALVVEQQGRPDESIAILERLSGSSLNRKSSLGHAYAMAGKTARARSVLSVLHAEAARGYVPSYYFALVLAGLGQRDQALRYLERAYDERSTVLAYLMIDPRLASLRDDPRFVTLARKLGAQ